MIWHKVHICDLCVHHEPHGCGVSKVHYKSIMFHKNHICNLCVFHDHELCECDFSSYELVNMISHKYHICSLCGLPEQFFFVEVQWFLCSKQISTGIALQFTFFMHIKDMISKSFGSSEEFWTLFTITFELFGFFYDHSSYVASILQLLWNLCHKYHIWKLCCLHELYV